MYEIYQIKNVNTLDEISEELNISISELIDINGLEKINNLKDGDYIIIPRRKNDNFITYIIQNGDTIYSLANKYNLNYEQLLNLNGLDKEEYIYPGEKIMVPNSNVLFWITNDNETLNDVAEKLDTTINEIMNYNSKIYLKPEQLFVIKKKD